MHKIQSDFNDNAAHIDQSLEAANILLAAAAADGILNNINEIESLYAPTLPSGHEPNIETRHDPIKHIRLIMEEGFGLGPATILEYAHRAEIRRQRIDIYYNENVKKANLTNPLFDKINEKDQPELLVRSVATLYLATVYEDNEKNAIKERLIDNHFKVNDYQAYGKIYCDGFKAAAVQIYNEAAIFLKEKNRQSLSDDLFKKAASINFDQTQAKTHSPNIFARERVTSEFASVAAVNKVLDPDNVRECLIP